MAEGRLPGGPPYILLREAFTHDADLDLCARAHDE